MTQRNTKYSPDMPGIASSKITRASKGWDKTDRRLVSDAQALSLGIGIALAAFLMPASGEVLKNYPAVLLLFVGSILILTASTVFSFVQAMKPRKG